MLLVVLLACVPKPVPPAEGANDPVPARPDGPVAGPHAIVEEPLPPPPPPDTPGSGPMHAYALQVRKVVATGLADCKATSPGATDAALVSVTVGADGNLIGVELARSSGIEDFDQCVLRAFRGGALPIPPQALVGDGGAVVMPQMAFRPKVEAGAAPAPAPEIEPEE